MNYNNYYFDKKITEIDFLLAFYETPPGPVKTPYKTRTARIVSLQLFELFTILFILLCSNCIVVL